MGFDNQTADLSTPSTELAELAARNEQGADQDAGAAPEQTDPP